MASRYIGTRNVGSVAKLHAANMPLMWQSDSGRAVRELTSALEKLPRPAITQRALKPATHSQPAKPSPASATDQKRYSKSTP